MGYSTTDGTPGKGLGSFTDTATTQADLNKALELIGDRGNYREGTTAERDALSGAALYDGLIWYSTTDKCTYQYQTSAWVMIIGSGTDAAGWSWRVNNGKRIYWRFYSSWAASNSFGTPGGSFYKQTRANIAVPTGKNWSNFYPTIDIWPSSPSLNDYQAFIIGYLSSTSGTSNVDLVFQNPSGVTVSNTNMNLMCLVTLQEI